MSTDLALACQGSGLAQRHGPCPCQGVLGTEMPVPWAAGNTAQSSAGGKEKLWLPQPGRAAASLGPRPPLGPSPQPWGPAEAALSGSGVADHGLPAAAAGIFPAGPAHPGLWFQQLQFYTPEGPREPPQAVRSQVAGKEMGQEHKPDLQPCLALLLHGLCRSGAPYPDPTAVIDSPGQGSLSSPPHQCHPPLSQQRGEGPWMRLQGPCPVTQAGRLSLSPRG